MDFFPKWYNNIDSEDINRFANEYNSFARQQLKLLREYINENANLVNQKKNKLEQILIDEIKSSPEVEPFIHSIYEEEIRKDIEVFPSLIHGSTYVTIYSFFEFILSEFCRQFQLFLNLNISINDLKGSGNINRSRKYFELVLRIDLSEKKKEWNNILKFHRIRNYIVHHNSNIWVERNKEIDKQQDWTTIVKQKEIAIDKLTGNFYITDSNLNLQFCDMIEQYLDFIVAKIKVNNVSGLAMPRSYLNTNPDDLPF
jgi:hypothetical protein